MAAKSKIAVELELQNSEYLAKIRKTQQATKGFGDKAGKSFISMKAALVGVGIAAVGLVAAFRSVMDVTNKQMRVEKQLEARLKSTGHAAGLSANEIKRMASALQEVTTVGDETILHGQNLLLTFTKIGRDVFPEATETMLNMSEVMDQGIKESAIQLGKALNDPIMGVTALRRVGVQLTDQQVEQIKSFMAINDIASAQKIILAELSTQMGGAARAAAETYEGKMKQLSNTLGDAKEAFGKRLQDAILEFSNEVSISKDEVIDLGDELGKLVAKPFEIIVKIVRAKKEFDKSIFGKFIDDAAKGYGDAMSQMSETDEKRRQDLADNMLEGMKGVNEAIFAIDRERIAKTEEAEKDSKTKIKEIQAQYGSDDQISYEKYLNAKLGLDSAYFAGLQTLSSFAGVFMAEKNKKMFRFGQALAISQAWINIALAVTKVLAQLGIFGPAAAGVIVAAGVLQTKKIAAQKPPEMAVGSWNVPQDMHALIHKGEKVLPEPLSKAVDRGEAVIGAGGGEFSTVHTHIYLDGEIIGDVVDNYRSDKARRMGANDYSQGSVY